MARFSAWLVAVTLSCGGTTPPNIVLIVIDTLRADHVSGYGYPRETTPNLDELVEAGVRFDAAISNSSWSAPSHATIATGASTTRHEVLDFSDRLSEEVEPIAAVLQRRGYATGLFSTHYALHNSVLGLNAGFEERLVLRNERDRDVVRAATQWAGPLDRPFFLQIVLMGPHAPYVKYPEAYDAQYFTDLPPGGEREYPFTTATWVGDGGIPRSVQLRGRRDAGFYINRYDRAIRFTDTLLGELLGGLRKAGRLDHALVVVVSDHGEGLGEHGVFAHELHLYDFLVRVPLVMSFPGVIPEGTLWTPVVPHRDVAPTILGLVDVPVPLWMDGRDLSAHLRTGTLPADDEIATGTYRLRGFERYMVRSRTHKLVYDAVEDSEVLYDLVADPSESRNLLSAAARGELPSEYGRLAGAMRSLRARHAGLGAGEDSAAPLPQDVVDELKALGYVEQD